MIERWICPFCRNAIAELPYGFDPNVVESLVRDHLVERHPIRRRLSRSVRTALRHPVTHTHSFSLTTGFCECGAKYPVLGPTGPTGLVGPSGPAPMVGPTGPVPLIEDLATKGKPAEIRTGYGTTTSLGSTGERRGFVGFRDRDWYAFRLYQNDLDDEDAKTFFARVHVDEASGFLELREIPNPWLCDACGKSYQDGAHTEFGFAGVDAHGYVARGAAA